MEMSDSSGYIGFMSKAPHGRIVRIRTLYLDESGFADQLWYAAIDDDQRAIDEVRKIDGTTNDQPVEIVGRLSPGHLEGLGLKTGKVKPAW